MHNNFGYKLVAVLDTNTLKLFKAEGLKIIEEIGQYVLSVKKERIPERHEGLRGNKSGLSPFHHPHTSKKDIELGSAARISLEHINEIIINKHEYKELYIVAAAKLLGHVRNILDKDSELKKKVVKEINKDLIHHNIQDIEKAIFA